ncbi:MAG: ribosomal RNA small subunit methyltransferase A [Phycisphaerales bacterium]|nr:ribosomal RNA small subunit methyltransferase A [Phycisphaerales bacterium]
MQSLSDIKDLLSMAGHGPKKALGQNFLFDHNLINKLIDASGVRAGDLVLEVGPGTGALTVAMLERGARVIAVELDSGLAGVLQGTLCAQYPQQMTLIEGDCLATKRSLNVQAAAAIGDQPFRLIANLPYHAATPLMIALMTRHPSCSGMFVTIQREVSQRFAAPVGGKIYGTVGVIAQSLGRVEHIATLPPTCFWPRPEVTSAMMGWHRDEHPIAGSDPDWWGVYADLTQALFMSRRKKISFAIKKLAPGFDGYPDSVSADARVDELSPAQIEALCRSVQMARDSSATR